MASSSKNNFDHYLAINSSNSGVMNLYNSLRREGYFEDDAY